MHALLNKGFDLFEELTSQQHNRSGAIAHLLNDNLVTCPNQYLNLSLTSASCDLAMSTNVLAAGCTISSNFMMVAPSFDMVALPCAFTISLSMPRGPNVVRTASTIDWQALIFDISCGLPCDVSVPSFRSTICGCCRTKQKVNNKLVSRSTNWQFVRVRGRRGVVSFARSFFEGYVSRAAWCTTALKCSSTNTCCKYYLTSYTYFKTKNENSNNAAHMAINLLIWFTKINCNMFYICRWGNNLHVY